MDDTWIDEELRRLAIALGIADDAMIAMVEAEMAQARVVAQAQVVHAAQVAWEHVARAVEAAITNDHASAGWAVVSAAIEEAGVEDAAELGWAAVAAAVADDLDEVVFADGPPQVDVVVHSEVFPGFNAGRLAHYEVTGEMIRFVTIGDDRVCPICEPLDDTTLRADDPWWSEYTPPLHEQCRCTVEPSDSTIADEDPPSPFDEYDPDHPDDGGGWGRPSAGPRNPTAAVADDPELSWITDAAE